MGPPPDHVWGPAVWSSLHALSFSYPVACDANCEHRKAFFELLRSLETLLPCAKCRSHYSEWRAMVCHHESSPIFDSRLALSEALVALHNDVRRQQHKTVRSYDEVKERYAGSKSSCPVGVDVSQQVNYYEAGVIIVVVFAVCAAIAIAVGQRCGNSTRR